MKNFLLSFIFLLIFSSCGSQHEDPQQATIPDTTTATKNLTVQTFEAGVVIPKVLCGSDARFSYSLYLPSDYSDASSWPVIIFFDPHAEGQLPVQKYQELSNKYGFILAGSNESKNGMQGGIYPDISKAIAGDVNARFKVDGKRLYLAGFSGGARVAINIGLADETVAGVIANSAGFDPASSPIKENCVIAGIAGNEDFNWLEQQRTEKSLDELPVQHCMLEFDGKHEWAPLQTMEKAFEFLDCSALRKGLKVKNDSLIKVWYEKDKTSLKKISRSDQKYMALKNFVSFYSGIFDIKSQEDELNKLKESSTFKLMIGAQEKAEAREAVLQNDYFKKLFSESIEWWDNEVKRMNSEKKNSEQYRMNKRVLSYISLAVYMTINSPQAQQDMLTLERLIGIYSVVDPENPEWAYLKALLRARQGNKREAIELISKSFELGFKDKERLLNQQEFSSILSDPEIQKHL